MTSSLVSDPAVADLDPLFRAWLLRHELPDAHARWRDASGEQAPLFAFTAVTCDGKLLHRLGPGGIALAEQAEGFAASVLSGKLHTSQETRATAQIVRLRIAHWRNRSGSGPPPPRPRLGVAASSEPRSTPKQLPLTDHLRRAVKDYPYFRESTARVLFREAMHVGAAGLHAVDAPFDVPVMLAIARYAARCSRGLIRGEVPTRDECMMAVALVQHWSAHSGKNPFTVDFSNVEDALDDLVIGLSRDVGACLAIAERFAGGPLAPGFRSWEDAEEYLSFAVLSLRPNQLSHMDLDQARRFASAAARLAASAIEHPAVHVPTFPQSLDAGSPRRVLACTRFALPNGPDPRRSARAALQCAKPADAPGSPSAAGSP
jgi:hypothetical protein